MKAVTVLLLTAVFAIALSAPVLAQYAPNSAQSYQSSPQTMYSRDPQGSQGPLSSQSSSYIEPLSPLQVVGTGSIVRGRIVSLDEPHGQVVISSFSGGTPQLFAVPSEQLEDFSVGDRVRIKYDPLTRTVESIRRTVFKNGRWVNH